MSLSLLSLVSHRYQFSILLKEGSNLTDTSRQCRYLEAGNLKLNTLTVKANSFASLRCQQAIIGFSPSPDICSSRLFLPDYQIISDKQRRS